MPNLSRFPQPGVRSIAAPPQPQAQQPGGYAGVSPYQLSQLQNMQQQLAMYQANQGGMGRGAYSDQGMYRGGGWEGEGVGQYSQMNGYGAPSTYGQPGLQGWAPRSMGYSPGMGPGGYGIQPAYRPQMGWGGQGGYGGSWGNGGGNWGNNGGSWGHSGGSWGNGGGQNYSQAYRPQSLYGQQGQQFQQPSMQTRQPSPRGMQAGGGVQSAGGF